MCPVRLVRKAFAPPYQHDATRGLCRFLPICPSLPFSIKQGSNCFPSDTTASAVNVYVRNVPNRLLSPLWQSLHLMETSRVFTALFAPACPTFTALRMRTVHPKLWESKIGPVLHPTPPQKPHKNPKLVRSLRLLQLGQVRRHQSKSSAQCAPGAKIPPMPYPRPQMSQSIGQSVSQEYRRVVPYLLLIFLMLVPPLALWHWKKLQEQSVYLLLDACNTPLIIPSGLKPVDAHQRRMWPVDHLVRSVLREGSKGPFERGPVTLNLWLGSVWTGSKPHCVRIYSGTSPT